MGRTRLSQLGVAAAAFASLSVAAAQLPKTVNDGYGDFVLVPAGRFTATRIEIEVRLNGGRAIRHERWYAPGVGLVKQVETDGRRKAVMVLKRFERGKK